MKPLILPSITTFVWNNQGNWRQQITEINQLDLKHVALFLTQVDFNQRQELFGLLEKTELKSVPFVHLKSDMCPEELEYLTQRWQTKVFNLHLPSEFPIENDLSKFSSKIFIENTYSPITDKDLLGFAGLCLDFSHMEDARLSVPELYKNWQEVFSKNSIGCGHISAIGKEGWIAKKENFRRFSTHWFSDLKEFDYLKGFPVSWFPKFVAIEVSNPLIEQLKAKEYIEQLLF